MALDAKPGFLKLDMQVVFKFHINIAIHNIQVLQVHKIIDLSQRLEDILFLSLPVLQVHVGILDGRVEQGGLVSNQFAVEYQRIPG